LGNAATRTDRLDPVGRRRCIAGDRAVDAIIREMSAIATTVAATVDQQNSAVASIAEGVSRASGEARMALRQ
jgi:hypothetical protein